MFSILDLMSEHTAFVSGCKLFYNDTEHCSSIILGVKVVCRYEIA